MEQKLLINKLPARTWNRLGVNETSIGFDMTSPELPAEKITSGAEINRVTVTNENDSDIKRVSIEAKNGETITVVEEINAAGKLAVETIMSVGDGAKIRLIQLHGTDENALLFTDTKGECREDGRIEIIQIMLGKGDVYSDTHIDLSGDGSSFKADIGYFAEKTMTLDMNLVVNQIAKKTESEINASGALKDAAKKIFRGTIDFRNGSSGSVGNEKETVLMLGEDVVNKTVPLILCAEEDVVGNHGATIGELDEDTLFYFGTRGISKDKAENIIARASIERLAREAGDSETEEKIVKKLDEVLPDA